MPGLQEKLRRVTAMQQPGMAQLGGHGAPVHVAAGRPATGVPGARRTARAKVRATYVRSPSEQGVAGRRRDNGTPPY